jgi:hypothetical protein
MGFYMEIFEARVLGENLYLHQRFTQCSKWSTSCILFRSCCNILHPTIKYVMPVEGEGGGFFLKKFHMKFLPLNDAASEFHNIA